MTDKNPDTGTRIDEIGAGIYRIHTPIREIPGGFSFNQILIHDDEPLLFHSGGRKLFGAVRWAIERVMPIDRLRWVGFSHVESDECGALNDVLAAAPRATAFSGTVGARICLGDSADRPARALADGESFSIGQKQLTWIDAPHTPHAWECGFLFESTTSTLVCGDLFTQPGADGEALTAGDILGPSEQFRAQMDYFSHSTLTRANIEKLARTQPRTLACMHGSAWTGDGAKLLRELGDALTKS